MLGFAWLTLRQADEAIQNGRLEEAHRLLCQPDAQGHKGSWELLRNVARGYVARAESHLRHDDVSAAWNDLIQAEQIGVSDDGAAPLRRELAQRGVAEARALLESGEPSRASEVIRQLNDRSVQSSDLKALEDAAQSWIQAGEMAARGEFALAVQAVKRADRLLPGARTVLERYQSELEDRGREFAGLIVRLHEAVQENHWREVLPLADRILALAPQQIEARKARARAWKSIEPETTPAPPPAPAQAKEATPEQPEPAQRFLLWIDGIGGYLVCLGPRVTLGQATPDAFVDIPLFADISRMHAALTRDPEGYLLEGLRPVQVNGKSVERALLRPEDRVTLGSSCQFQFRQPVPVSASARLDMTSGHRLPLAVDTVFLMADTLVLGSGPQAHVLIPELANPVVLFRRKDGLGVQHSGNLLVDGVVCKERGSLGPTAHVSGDDFAFSVEPLGRRMGRAS